MDDVFQDIGLDSLDGLVMLMYFDELYGIDDAVSKEWSPKSVQELYDLVMANKTKEPASMEEVAEVCK
jgi:acyl carrier protein